MFPVSLLTAAGLLILFSFLYFVPLGLVTKEKFVLAAAALLLSCAGNLTWGLFPLWQTILILFLMVILVSYILEKQTVRTGAAAETAAGRETDQPEVLFEDNMKHTEEAMQFGVNEIFQIAEKPPLAVISDHSAEEVNEEAFDPLTLEESKIEEMITDIQPNVTEPIPNEENNGMEILSDIEKLLIDAEEMQFNGQEAEELTAPLSDVLFEQDFNTDIEDGGLMEEIIVTNDSAKDTGAIGTEKEDGIEESSATGMAELEVLVPAVSESEEEPAGKQSLIEKALPATLEEGTLPLEMAEWPEAESIEKELESLPLNQENAGETENNQDTIGKVQSKNIVKDQLLSSLVHQIVLMKGYLNQKEYENLIKQHLDPALPDQDYFTFAQLLIEHYMSLNKDEALAQFLTKIQSRYHKYPGISAEINHIQQWLKNK